MYDKFFIKLMQMKGKQVQELSENESKRLEEIKQQFQKLEQEWENQQSLQKEVKRPTEKKSIKENITALEAAGEKLEKQIKIIETKLKNLDNDKTLKKLFYSLKQHEDIEKVMIEEDKMQMIILTKNLCARKTMIGQYIILMSFEDREILIKRADDLKYSGSAGNYYHPFIKGNGEVCFGDAGDKIKNALKQGGFYSTVIICIELLKYSTSGANPYVTWGTFRRWVIKQVPQPKGMNTDDN
mgnify:CR=1 FL=1